MTAPSKVAAPVAAHRPRGESNAVTRPASSNRTRSAISATSLKVCEANKSVVPCWRTRSSFNRRRKSEAASGSRLRVGLENYRFLTQSWAATNGRFCWIFARRKEQGFLIQRFWKCFDFPSAIRLNERDRTSSALRARTPRPSWVFRNLVEEVAS